MLYASDAELLLETKYCHVGEDIALKDGMIEGYASLFGTDDQSGDSVRRGAYAASLARLAACGRRVRMLWQHDPMQPIGVWDEVREDEKGLYVKGRLLKQVQAGREAWVLLEAGAIDGLSIGYRTVRAEKASTGRRILHEIELWEVSVVTFPMLAEARVRGKAAPPGDTALACGLAEAFRDARKQLATPVQAE